MNNPVEFRRINLWRRRKLGAPRLPVKCALVFIITFGACAPRNPPTHASHEQWRADLRYLASELPQRHANAFHTVTRELFAAEAAQLDSEMPELNEDQILVGLMRLVALVGDGHTHLDPAPTGPRYPLEFSWFGDELRAIAADIQYAPMLGARLLIVGTAPVDSAMRVLSALVPRGENEGRTRLTATMLLASPAVLHGSGLSPSSSAVPFTFETAAGGRITLNVQGASTPDMANMRLAVEPPPLWLHRLREPWWTETLPAAQTVYLSFRGYPAEATFRSRAEELASLLDESRARRLVIDLRLNGGGDFELGRRFLLPVLQRRPRINVYVITGPGTFSAAMVNALDLRNDANATLVGEPTGARPNSYSEHGEMRLPNSGLRVSYSTRIYRFGADADTAVVPDKHIEQGWEQFRGGRDPVMEWILAQPIR